jgi:serine/threonine protein kinase/tetratricopeptide (TPR) repeat protein
MVESQSAEPGRPGENEKTIARDATDTLAPSISPPVGEQIGPKIRSQTLLNGRFLLESLLGQGGMGEVWLGLDQVLARPVAAKIIRPLDPGIRDRTLYDTNARESFINEARIGANLLHPAIATVFDFGFHEGEPFIVFEYLPGETVRTLIERRKKLSVEDSRLIVGPLAQALDFAHGNHIVHRDLKPDNIRATRQGHFKILDLGLAKEFRKSVDWESFSGTPAYTSPEQAGGLPCDGRADQYALAIIAYELMTGHRPFISDDWMELVRMQREAEPPSPRVHAPELPGSICDALLRGLAKDPNKRFPSCEEFATAIGCQLLTDPIATPQLLRVARVKKRGRGHRFVFNKSRLKAFLGQSRDSFWVSDQDEIRSLPLCDMKESGGTFRTLRVTFVDAGREYTESFEFSSGARCDVWKQSLRQLRSELLEGTAGLNWTVSLPIVSMGRAPPIRHQILGPVEYVGADDAESAAGVEFQAAIMDADAIVNLQQERLPDLRETMYRHSGLAIRVVDLEGRRELQSRRLAMELSRGSKLMWGLALAAMVTAMSWILSLNVLAAVILGFFVILWPVFIVRLTRRLLWPQLVWPAAVSILAVGLMPAAEWIAALIYVVVNARWNYLLLTLLGATNLVITGFALYLAARYLRVHNGYKAVYADSGLPASDVRRVRSRAAVGVSILYLILVVSVSAVHKYITISASFLMSDEAEASRQLEEGVNESQQQPPALDKAVASYQLALQKWQALAEAHPARAEYRAELARTYFNRGIALAGLNKVPEAEQSLRQAIDQADALPMSYAGLAVSVKLRDSAQKKLTTLLDVGERNDDAVEAERIRKLGIARLKQERPDAAAAEQSFREALRKWQLVAQASKATAEIETNIAAVYFNLASALYLQDKFDASAEAVQNSIGQCDLLLRYFPSDLAEIPLRRQAEDLLSTIRLSLAGKGAHQSMKDGVAKIQRVPPAPEAAERDFRASIQKWNSLFDSQNSNPGYRVQLAIAYFDLGLSLRSQGKFDDAGQALRRATEQLDSNEAAFRTYPKQSELRGKIQSLQSQVDTKRLTGAAH